MKTLFIALLASLTMFLGMAPSSYAIKDGAALGRQQDETLVVKNVQGEDVGTIRGALEDPMGDIAFVVISLKEEANGKKEVVVPVNAFSQGTDEETFVLDLSKEALASAPEFNATKLDDPAYAEGLYTFYGQTPPWTE